MRKVIIIGAVLLLITYSLSICFLNGCKKNESINILQNNNFSFLDSVDFTGALNFCSLLKEANTDTILPQELYTIFDKISKILTTEEMEYLVVISESSIFDSTIILEGNELFISIYCKLLSNSHIRMYLPYATIDKYLTDEYNIIMNFESKVQSIEKSNTLAECYSNCASGYTNCINGADDAYDEYVANVANMYIECDENASNLSFPYNYEAQVICLAAYTYGMNAAAQYYAAASESCSNSVDECMDNCDERHSGGGGN